MPLQLPDFPLLPQQPAPAKSSKSIKKKSKKGSKRPQRRHSSILNDDIQNKMNFEGLSNNDLDEAQQKALDLLSQPTFITFSQEEINKTSLDQIDEWLNNGRV